MSLHSSSAAPVAFAAALAVAALAAPPVAHAQIAAALGKPLPDGSLEVGTVTVRVFEGSPQKPLVGASVSLVPADGEGGGPPRIARTDAEGRATFNKLPPGGRFIARVAPPAEPEAAEGQDAAVQSEPFAVPERGGVRMMLSTVPFEGAGGQHAGGPAGAMGPGGMPNPRQMSGVPRPERGHPARQLTIRVVHGSMETAANAIGQMVHLVGFHADGRITVTSEQTEDDGRVHFDDLVPRMVAYYAMTVLVRDDGTEDRLRSETIVMPPEVGVRLVLSGEARDSEAPPVDDFGEMVSQGGAGPAGTLVVRIDGMAQSVDEAELLRLGGAEPERVATAPVGPAVPNPSAVSGAVAAPTGDAALAAGTLVASVRRAVPPQGDTPLGGAAVEVREVAPAGAAATAGAAAGDAGQPPVATLDSARDGTATFTGLTPGKTYQLAVVVYGKRIESAPFALPAAGGVRATATVAWQVLSRLEARFGDVDSAPAAVYAARVRHDGQDYYSSPFQMIAGRGAAAVVIVYPPRVVTQFHLNGQLDDEYMGFQVQLSLHNVSQAPRESGPDGLLIPLPAGFVGAAVAEEFQDAIKIDPDRGLIWRGAIPPGGVRFIAGFSLPVEGGGFHFSMPLPYGAFQSNLVLEHTPGMKFESPAGARPDLRELDNGMQFLVVRSIDISAGQSMVFTVTGLPQQAAQWTWIRVGAGLAVLALLALGVGGMLRGRIDTLAGGDAGPDQGSQGGQAGRTRKLVRRREQLLEELVALEAKHRRGDIDGPSYQRSRDRLTGKLEAVYAEIAGATGGEQGRRSSAQG